MDFLLFDMWKVNEYTGWRDQIVRPVNLILLPNQKTWRTCKDSFGIKSNRATKSVFD